MDPSVSASGRDPGARAMAEVRERGRWSAGGVDWSSCPAGGGSDLTMAGSTVTPQI